MGHHYSIDAHAQRMPHRLSLFRLSVNERLLISSDDAFLGKKIS